MSGLFGHTEAGVADIREMIRRSKSKRFDNGFRWHPSGGSRPVVVRLEEDIDEDDFDEHPAEVLDDGRRTKTYVMVRNAGQLPLEKDAKLTAIPIPNAGLCVCGNERPSTFQPLNVGVLDAQRQAIYAADSLSIYDMGELYRDVWPNSSTYYNLQPEDLFARNYMLNEKERLHVVAVGMPPGAQSNFTLAELFVRPSTSQAARDRASRAAAVPWVPEPDSVEEIAIQQYLAAGGTVLAIVDQWPVYELGELVGTIPAIGGSRYLHPWVFAQAAKMNTFLERLGSAVRMFRREDFVPEIPPAPPQFPIIFGCSHVPLLPPNGIFAVNPDVWLGRSRGIRRLFDARQFAKLAEMDAVRGGGYAAMKAAGSTALRDSFYELNGAYTPSQWMRFERAFSFGRFDAQGPAVTPWTINEMFGLSAPRSLWYTATYIGRRYWTNRFQFGLPEFEWDGFTLDAVSGAFAFSFTRRVDGIPHIDPASVFPMPTSTAERLPNGGRLVVTTLAAFPCVAEALVRSIQSGDMLELTSHFVAPVSNPSVDDRHGRKVFPLTRVQQVLPRFVSASLTVQRYPARRAFAIGEGIQTLVSEAGVDSTGNIDTSLYMYTKPEPDTVPTFAYRPTRDGTKTNWQALGGVTAIWTEVSEEVPEDATGGFSAVNSQSPLTLVFEPIDPPASSVAVTVTFRAAKCDASGNLTSTGNASLQLELIGQSNQPPVSVNVADLTDVVQEFTWTFNTTERGWAFDYGANPQIRFRPNASDCGVLLTYVAITAGRSSEFEALLMSVSCDCITLTTNLAECPWAHTWRGVHPTFKHNLTAITSPTGFFANSYFNVAYSLDDLAAWGHVSAGLVRNPTPPFNGETHAPPRLSADGYWRKSQTLQTSLTDRFTTTERITGLVVQRDPARDVPRLFGPGGGPLETFPVIFQNGKFLRPLLWETTRDKAELDGPEFGGFYRLFDRYRARTSLKGWQDITRWPEVSEDPRQLVDIQTEPDSPPVCIGVGAVATMRYGVSGAQSYRANLDLGLTGLDFAIQQDTASVRAIWQQNYGGAS